METELSLLDPSCKAKMNGTHFILESALHSCGTRQIVYPLDNIVYLNSVSIIQGGVCFFSLLNFVMTQIQLYGLDCNQPIAWVIWGSSPLSHAWDRARAGRSCSPWLQSSIRATSLVCFCRLKHPKENGRRWHYAPCFHSSPQAGQITPLWNSLHSSSCIMLVWERDSASLSSLRLLCPTLTYWLYLVISQYSRFMIAKDSTN